MIYRQSSPFSSSLALGKLLLLETGSVSWQILCIFLPKWRLLCLLPSNVFCNTWYKMFTNSLLFTAWDVHFEVFFGMNVWTEKYFSSSLNISKCSLTLNSMYIKTFIKLNVRFENWGIFHGVNHWTLLSFSWGVFDHVTPTEQSCTSRNMSWVIAYDVKCKAPSL